MTRTEIGRATQSARHSVNAALRSVRAARKQEAHRREKDDGFSQWCVLEEAKGE